MDPRAALLQQESDDNNRFRNRSIGMHNLRAKLREQLKGYSHVRGFPLESDGKRNADNADSGRTESLNVRRDSMRRRASSVTRQQNAYDPEDSDGEQKYKQRRTRKKESLLIPRLLWFSVYASLCFVAYKGLKYFGGQTEVPLCLPCAGANQCGVLDDEFVVPVDSLGGLSFGTIFPKKSQLYCRTDLCVPSHVADPQALCRVVSDEALLYRTRRLLQAGDDNEEQAQRFQEYFRRRAMREEGLAGALSPNSDNTPSRSPSPTPSATPARNPNSPDRTPSTPERTPSSPSRTPDTPDRTPSATPSRTPSSENEGRDRDSGRSPPPTTTPSPTPRSQAPPPRDDDSKAKAPTITPPASAPKASTPAEAPSPDSGDDLVQGNYANGAYSAKRSLYASLASLPSGGGECTATLRFEPTRNEGYANLTAEYFRVIANVSNFAECCGLCWNDPQCVAWTRVAGGDASVRQCYLHATLLPDPNSASRAHNWQPDRPVYPPNPVVRYTVAVPIMFESGTKFGTELPGELYGCPYPPSEDGTCQVPPGCNCGGGRCYPGCIAPNLAGVKLGAPAAAKAAPATAVPSNEPAAKAAKDAKDAEGPAKGSEDLAEALAASPTRAQVPAADLAAALAASPKTAE